MKMFEPQVDFTPFPHKSNLTAAVNETTIKVCSIIPEPHS